jgi:hypothetical protein
MTDHVFDDLWCFACRKIFIGGLSYETTDGELHRRSRRRGDSFVLICDVCACSFCLTTSREAPGVLRCVRNGDGRRGDEGSDL